MSIELIKNFQTEIDNLRKDLTADYSKLNFANFSEEDLSKIAHDIAILTSINKILTYMEVLLTLKQDIEKNYLTHLLMSDVSIRTIKDLKSGKFK